MRQWRPTIGVRGGHGRAVQPGTSGPIGWPYGFMRSGMPAVCPARSGPCESAYSTHAPRGVSPEARLREDARAGAGRSRSGPGPAAIQGARRRFVVQRHRATRLHYDFRLEIDGVLASWAVPKGPTLDPSIRRMAVHVEDHPMEYFDFEGTIPAKQYGAGDVIVWDWGTWEPEAETPEPAAAVANGELKFVLDGQKVSGRYTLVRTSRRPGHRAADGVRGRRRRAVAADPQARRRQHPGLGRRGPPAQRQVRPDERRGQGERAGDLGVRGAGGDGRDRPVGGARDADAALPRADEGDAHHPGVPRRGLAVRDQVGRLPGRGGRARRQGGPVHPQRPRRRDVLPAPAHPADVDPGARGDRGRRGRRARRARPPGLLAPPGADQRGTDGPARAARLPGLRPALPRRPLARRRAPRVAQAPARARDPAQLAGPVRAPHRHRGRRVLRGGQGAGPRRHRGQAPPLALRAGPPVVVVAQGQGATGAGAGRRRLDAGGGDREGPGRGRRRRLRGRATAIRGQGRLRVRRAHAQGAEGDPRGARDRRAAVRPAARARLPRPVGRRPRGRAMDPAGARDPRGARRLDAGRARPPDIVQGPRARARPARGRPRAGGGPGEGRSRGRRRVSRP